MALLSGCGCGGGSGDGDENGEGTPIGSNTPAEVAASIIGTWDSGCNEEDGLYYNETLTFNADKTGVYHEAEYDAPDCNPADKLDERNRNFNYVVGDATTGADGEDAVELDFMVEERGEQYTMARFDADTLYLAGGDDDVGTTPDNRANDFSDVGSWTRQ